MAVRERAAALWARFYFLRDLRLWAFGAACAAFFWGFSSVSSALSPSAFDLAVRGVGLKSFSTAFVLLSSSVDQALMVVGFAYVFFVIEFGLSDIRLVWRVLLAVPAILLTFSFFLPALLLPLGGLGILMEIVYIVIESDSLLGASPGKALAPIVLLMTASTALLSFLSAGRWLANAVDGVAPFSDWTWGPSLTLLSVINQVYWLMPRLLLVLFLAWGIRIVLAFYWDEVASFWRGVSHLFGPVVGTAQNPLSAENSSSYILLVALLGSVVAGLYAYFPAINPSSVLSNPFIGVSYYSPVQLMMNQGSSWALGYAVTHGSPVLLLITYAMAVFFGSADVAVRLVPALLAVVFAAATYSFARVALKDAEVAATAALFAAFSFALVAGVNGGLEDTWLAAGEALVFFSLLLTGLERPSWIWVGCSVVVSVLILPTHAWTWLVSMGVVAAYALFAIVRRVLSSRSEHFVFSLASSAVILAVNAGVYVLADRLGSAPDPSAYLRPLVADFGPGNAAGAVGTLQSTLSLFLGGALDEPVVICLAIVGVLAMTDLLSDSKGLLFLWLLIGSLGAVFAGFGPSFPVARIFLFIPVELFAALGFVSALRYVSGLISRGSVGNSVTTSQSLRWSFVNPSTDTTVRVFVALAYVSLFSVLVSYALQNAGFI